MPIRLTPDGRETLEDALRIFVETAGDEPMRREREKAGAALWAELSGHPIMAAAVRSDHEGVFEGALDHELHDALEGLYAYVRDLPGEDHRQRSASEPMRRAYTALAQAPERFPDEGSIPPQEAPPHAS